MRPDTAQIPWPRRRLGVLAKVSVFSTAKVTRRWDYEEVVSLTSDGEAEQVGFLITHG